MGETVDGSLSNRFPAGFVWDLLLPAHRIAINQNNRSIDQVFQFKLDSGWLLLIFRSIKKKAEPERPCLPME